MADRANSIASPGDDRLADRLSGLLDELSADAIDALPAPIYTTDADGFLTHFNPAAIEFSGRVPERGSDRWCVPVKLYHTDGTFMPHDQCPMAIALREGRSLRGDEAIAERPDGSRVRFASYPAPLFDACGRVIGGINLLIDVTEKRQSEALLHEQRLVLEIIASRASLDDSLSALCRAVPRLTANARAAILLADERRERVQRCIAPDLLPVFGAGLTNTPIDDPRIGTCGEAVFRGEPVTCADIAHDDSWSKAWSELCLANGVHAGHSTPIPSIDGPPFGSFFLCLDTARAPTPWEQQLADFAVHIASIALERDRTEHELRRSEASLAAQLRDAELLQEISGHLIEEEVVDSLYQRIMEAAVEIMGSQYGSMQMLEKERGASGELRLLAQHGFSARAAELWAWVTPDGGTSCGVAWRAGARVMVPDVASPTCMTGIDQASYLEAGIHAMQSTPLVSRSGALLGMISTHWTEPHEVSERDLRLLDILARQAADLVERLATLAVERRTLEETRLARAAADQANEAKSAFMATMSHELRTPLNAILGFSHLLALEIAGPLTAQQKEHLGRIDTGSRHLLSLIEQILTFARVEAGRETVFVESLDVAELARDTASFVEPLAAAKRIAFACDAPEQLTIESDVSKLRQVLLNLLSNAVKFTEEGEIRLDVRSEGADAIIRVRDTGVGIAAHHIPRIFEPFSQIDQSLARKTGGTGLGLTVTAQLAHLLGGEVAVESTPGVGSVFTVRMPRWWTE